MATAPEFAVFLLRHAATAWNREGRYLGCGDADIDDAARAGLADLAGPLTRFAPDHVVSSPAMRARQTAEELIRLGVGGSLGAGHCASYRVDPDARELGFGVFEGRTRAEINESDHAGAFERWLRVEHGRPAAPRGESWSSVEARARRVLDRIAPGRTLLVSHGYFLKAFLVAAADQPRANVRDVHFPNARPILLERRPGGPWQIDSLATVLGDLLP